MTAGDVDANRELVDRVGLRAPVLLKRDGVEPFGPLGTPASTLLDEEGRVAAKLASGAFEVPAEAARLAGVELPTPSGNGDGQSAEGGESDGVHYLPAAGGMCGPGAASGPKTEWAGTLAVNIAGTHVGVRYNSDATRMLLEKLFVGSLVDDPTVPDNYSVVLTGGDGRSRDLELLVQGTRQLVRSRSRARVLAALLAHLEHDVLPADPGLLHVRATPAVGTDGTALLLPAGLVDAVGKLQPRLAKIGLTFADLPTALVDPERAELIVPTPGIEHDPAVLDDVDGGVRLGRTELPRVLPGRYPLRAWYLQVWGSEEERVPVGDDGVSPALAVASTLGLCFTDDLQATAAELVTLVDAVPVRPISYESAAQLVARVQPS